MSALLETIQHFLDNETIRELGDQIGADPEMTRQGVKVALPLFIGALAQRAGESAEALYDAIEQDHDGSLLDNLQDVLRRSAKGGGTMGGAGTDLDGGLSVDPQAVNGDGIADHVLGKRRPAVENGMSRASRLDVKKVDRLVAYLAPIVMSALGRLRSELELDASGIRQLLDEARDDLTVGMDPEELGQIFDGNDRKDGEIAERVEETGRQLVASGVEEFLFNPGSSRHFRKKGAER